MSEDIKKPTDKLTASTVDGKVITDSVGKVYTLRQPDVLDTYDFAKALGEDANSANLFSMMFPLLFIAKMDNQVFETPRVYSECRAALKRVGAPGINAVREALAANNEITGEGEKDSIKKS